MKVLDTVEQKWQDIGSRVLTMLISLPIIFACLFFGGWWYVALGLLFGIQCSIELQRLLLSVSYPILPLLISVSIILLAATGFFEYTPYIVLIVILIVLVQIVRLDNSQTSKRLRLIGVAIGSFYVGLPLAALIDIRSMQEGLGWTMVIFTTIWFTDSFALVGGRLYGQRKLAPKISERKTIEGAMTGFVCAAIGAAVMLWIFNLPVIAGCIVSMIASLLTIIGDLVASVFKRYFNVKDTGSILPGHGGLIDRLDGLFLAVIPFYTYLVLF